MACSLPDASVHGILQATILEWVAIHFSRGSSGPRDGPRVSCIAGRFFPIWAPREALNNKTSSPHIPAGTISGASRTSEHFHQPSLSFYLKNAIFSPKTMWPGWTTNMMEVKVMETERLETVTTWRPWKTQNSMPHRPLNWVLGQKKVHQWVSVSVNFLVSTTMLQMYKMWLLG